MSTPTTHHRVRIRVQRVASLVLSVVCAIVASANIFIIVEGRWNVLTDGTFGMPPLIAFLIDAMQYSPVVAIAAIILAGTASVSATAPAVDALPRRLPMIIAVVACALVAGYYLIPALMIVGWLLFGAIGLVFPTT